MIVYMTAVFLKELKHKQRGDNKKARSATIIASILSTSAILIWLFSLVFRLEGQDETQVIAFIFIFISLGTSLIYFLRNYRHFESYIASEFLVVLAPALIVIVIHSHSSLVPKKSFNEFAENILLSQNNNNYLLENFEIDSTTKKSLNELIRVKTDLIEYSGGQLENGVLVSGSSRDYFFNYIFRRKGFEKIQNALTNLDMTTDELEWLDLEKASDLTVVDAVLKIDLLINQILIENINKSVPGNGEHEGPL